MERPSATDPFKAPAGRSPRPVGRPLVPPGARSLPACASAAIAGQLPIPAGAELVNKPQHSAFFETSLGQRLKTLAPDEVWVAGVATDLCVPASAIDASMRGFAVRVPADVVASESDEKWAAALLLLLRESFKLETAPWPGGGSGPHGSSQPRPCTSVS